MKTILLSAVLTAAFLLFPGCTAPHRSPMPAWDAELARLNKTARAAYDSGSLSTACTLYEQSLSRARALDADAEIANSAYNLALCHMVLGEYEAARALLREAEAELIRLKDNLADVLLLKAKLAQRQGRSADARRFAEQVLSNPASVPTASHRADVALLEGELACNDGDPARARAALKEATHQASALTNLALHTGCEKLAGRIYLLENKPTEAAKCFDRETAFRRQGRQAREVVRALIRSGEAWRDAGQPAVAAERFFRAARSQFAQGDTEEAMKCVEISLALATEARDEALQQRVLQLKSEIQSSIPPP